MTIIKVVLIPSDPTKPVQEVDYDEADYTNLTALIFDGDRSGTFQAFSLGNVRDGDVLTFWHDDDGLARLETEDIGDVVNLRAMELVGKLSACGIRDIVPLIGNYVITGDADDEGESLPAPAWVKDHEFTWHHRYGVRKVADL